MSNILYGILLVFLAANLLVPDVKAWTLQQLMKVGLFQPGVPVAGKVLMPSPEMLFRDSAGHEVSISSLRGKVVVISFWATWCPPCRAEMPSLNSFYEQYKDNPHIVFLAVDADSNTAKAIKFMRDHSYNLPVYTAASAIPGEVYSGTLPTTVIIDKQGNIILRETGATDYNNRGLRVYIGSLLTHP